MRYLKKAVPSYAILPFALAVIWNFTVYYGGKLAALNRIPVELDLWLDERIPLVPAFMGIYVLAYVQWIVGYVVIASDSKETCYKTLGGELAAKAFVLLIFILLPTTINRPEVTGQGFFVWLTRFIYSADTPICLFPSVHCLNSWFCFRGTFCMKKVPVWYQIFMLCFTLLVFASVVLVRQHNLVDILGGILAVEAGLFLSKRWNFGHVYDIIEKKIRKKRDQNEY